MKGKTALTNLFFRMANFNIVYSHWFSLKLTGITIFFLNLQIISWTGTYWMVWTLKDTVHVFLWRVYNLVGKREMQINNGDTVQNVMSSPGGPGRWGCWEKLLGEGDIWDPSEFEDVGEREGREMVPSLFFPPVNFFYTLQKNLVLFT